MVVMKGTRCACYNAIVNDFRDSTSRLVVSAAYGVHGKVRLAARPRQTVAQGPTSPLARGTTCPRTAMNGALAGKSSRPQVRCRAQGSGRSTDVERSALIAEEVLMFMFQQELDVQLQRALNHEAFQVAQEIRNRRQRVDEAVTSLQEQKGVGTGAVAARKMGDTAASGLRLRSELQLAVKEERYDDAARIRDELAQLGAESADVQSSFDEAAQAGEPRFPLGCRCVHRVHGYRVVVCGWDWSCCESERWQKTAGVDLLARGAAQPFYHVLVDEHDWQFSDSNMPPIGYVAQELLSAPGLSTDGGGRTLTWLEAYGSERFSHAFSLSLFLGVDARGDMIPTSALRDKYNAERRDVYPPGKNGEEDDEGDDGDPDKPDAGTGGPVEGGDGFVI